MKTTGKDKRVIVILLVLIFLCILIPLGIRWIHRETPPVSTNPAQTLEALLGGNYVQFLTDTITMQMENRMDKKPEIRYYPVEQQKALGEYVAIGEETQFEVDDEGYLTIIFPAGTVTELAHGEQRFRIIRITQEEEAAP